VDDGAALARRCDAVEIVGVMLVHDEDVFVERALRNVAAFCDRIHVADHMSSDGTWEIVQRLAAELGHVDAVRVRATGDSHALVEGYAGTHTWVFGVDGDELYDPSGLARFRSELTAGAHREHFSLKGNVLHLTELDPATSRATGHLAPPSRSVTKLFNFAAIDSWTDVHRQYAHDGEIAFRPGYSRESLGLLGDRYAWEDSPFRCLHVCFLPRSSRDTLESARQGRPSPIDLGGKRRTRATALLDRLRPAPPASAWKDDKYRRGELVTVDASPFLP
jgi:glycosyltransferase involved in cell wall biosynthesis